MLNARSSCNIDPSLGSTQNPPPRPGKLVTPSPSLTGAEAEDREGLVWCTQARLGPSNQVR